jgi:hypothetical protein
MPVPVFAAGEILTAANMNQVGLWLVKSQAIGTTVSSVTVTGAFSSDFDNYLITVSGGTSSANADNLGLQMGSTTTGYRGSVITVSTANAVSGAYTNNTENKWTNAGAVDSTGVVARIELTNPFLSLATYMQASMIRAGAQSHFTSFGSLANSTSYTAFTITPGSGTLTGGNVCVYGYRK